MRENSLHETALRYLCNFGWSIIPLQGEGSNGKRPLSGIYWSKYRKQLPGAGTVRDWFKQNEISAIGIICGMISGLIVIEFDKGEAYQKFEKTVGTSHPELLETFTVTSGGRGLPHLYYRVDYPVHNRDSSWGSLRSEGRYVVAAGSRINGNEYRIIKDVKPRYLEPEAFEIISRYLTPDTPEKIQLTRNDGIKTNLVQHYRIIAPAIGRNNALFQTAIEAKKQHISMETCAQEITDIHIHTKPFWQHEKENEHQRRAEAIRTITSAYNSTITTLPKIEKQRYQGLPNHIREQLIETQKSSITVRLLDTLIQYGYMRDKDIICSTELNAIAEKHGLAHHSIRKVTKGKLGEIKGKRIIRATSHSDSNKKHVMYNDNRVINQGRPPQYFKIIRLSALIELLEIDDQRSDPLTGEDLQSDTAYRKALHRNLLKYRPGQYGLAWMAKRIGRSIRTIQRYNEALQVRKTPIYGRMQVTWSRLKDAIFYDGKRRKDGITPGYWIQTQAGERFPSMRGLAAKLMAKGQRILTCWRMPNHYAISSLSDAKHAHPEPIWRTVETDVYAGETHSANPVNKPHNRPEVPFIDGQKLRVKVPYTDREVTLPMRDSCGRAVRWQAFDVDRNGYPVLPKQFTQSRLTWDNVEHIIPPDEINEEINGHRQWWKQAYLMITDYYAKGIPKRFPVMRGLALRLVKEYGENAVLYVCRQNPVAQHHAYEEGLFALESGDIDTALRYFRQAGLMYVRESNR